LPAFSGQNDFDETLAAVIHEAGLDPNVGATSSGDAVTLEYMLKEKKIYD